ncbi:hypothetical protein [Sporosarcina cascadiensis]|uniref:hypothetical protein n=1 Tax=Sporosarcina cascadiensis TaxID=2660747 RepID=UPI00129A2497|nr:hypothetical protein [Sporosarcina cascadiensis]
MERVRAMKKVWVMLVLIVLALSACSSPELGLKEVSKVPDRVQEKIVSDLQLQLIIDKEHVNYLIFHSAGEVEASVEAIENVATIKLDVTNGEAGDVTRNIYLFTTGDNTDTINILINGEPAVIDVIST